jgi:hypothetical protein
MHDFLGGISADCNGTALSTGLSMNPDYPQASSHQLIAINIHAWHPLCSELLGWFYCGGL